MDMVSDTPMLLDMALPAPLAMSTLLVLPPLLPQVLLVDMPLLDVTVPTLLVLSIVPRLLHFVVRCAKLDFKPS